MPTPTSSLRQCRRRHRIAAAALAAVAEAEYCHHQRHRHWIGGGGGGQQGWRRRSSGDGRRQPSPHCLHTVCRSPHCGPNTVTVTRTVTLTYDRLIFSVPVGLAQETLAAGADIPRPSQSTQPRWQSVTRTSNSAHGSNPNSGRVPRPGGLQSDPNRPTSDSGPHSAVGVILAELAANLAELAEQAGTAGSTTSARRSPVPPRASAARTPCRHTRDRGRRRRCGAPT